MPDSISYLRNRIADLESLLIYEDNQERIEEIRNQIAGLERQLQDLIAAEEFSESFENDELDDDEW